MIEREVRRDLPARPRAIDDVALDLEPRRPARWETASALAHRDPESVSRAGGWLMRLILRLALIALVLGVGFVVVVYLVARSLY